MKRMFASTRATKVAMATLAAVTVLAAVQPANTQGYNQGRPSITLFAGLDYKGQSVTITSDTPNLRDLNFNEVSNSLVARGEWEVRAGSGNLDRCYKWMDCPDAA